MDRKPTKIVILGGGESGVGAAILANKLGYSVFVSDKGTIDNKYQNQLTQLKIPFEENGHTKNLIALADLVVKSPGIPNSINTIQALLKKGIPVISEIEFGAKHTTIPIIAITGTNGKSTTSKLTWHLMKTAGLNVALGGNIGKSFAQLVAHDQPDYYVLEISSFQLENCPAFQPSISAILNITPDHLDRYGGSMEDYAAAKFQIFKNQRKGDTFIFNQEEEWVQKGIPEVDNGVKKIGIYPNKKQSGQELNFEGYTYRLNNPTLLGQHNASNALFAIAIARQLNIEAPTIQKGLDDFEGLPHRMQPLGTHNGVAYINDSKATNIDAAFYALDAIPVPIIWIAGGIDKGNDYQLLYPFMDKIKAVIAIGKDNQKIWNALEGFDFIKKEAESMQSAVNIAAAIGSKNDTVLLSPACSSFDRFKNFEQRGELFEKAVKELTL